MHSPHHFFTLDEGTSHLSVVGSLQPYEADPSSTVCKIPVKLYGRSVKPYARIVDDRASVELVPCENCDGQGEFVDRNITGYDPRTGDPLGWEEEYPCPVCGGSGRMPQEGI